MAPFSGWIRVILKMFINSVLTEQCRRCANLIAFPVWRDFRHGLLRMREIRIPGGLPGSATNCLYSVSSVARSK